MDREAAKRSLDYLMEIFPHADLQEAELKVFCEALLPFDYEPVIEMMKRHRLENSFNRPKIEKIIGPLRPVETPALRAKRDLSFVDGIRKQFPHLANRSNPELIFRYHRANWLRSRRSDGTKRGIEAKCESDLIAFMDADAARRAAAFVCADDPTFKLAMADLEFIGVEIPEF